MHDLHASKFHSIFFYRFRFTRFWHMNHTASQKPDLCSIGLGHSFALSLRKTSDKRCNSNCNLKKTKTHISCATFAPNFDESGFHLESILASLKGIFLTTFSFGVYIWCDLDVHAFLLRSLSPSQVLAFHRGLSFLHSTLRLDVSTPLTLSSLWLRVPGKLHQAANFQVSKRQTQEPCEASRKTCPNRL